MYWRIFSRTHPECRENAINAQSARENRPYILYGLVWEAPAQYGQKKKKKHKKRFGEKAR